MEFYVVNAKTPFPRVMELNNVLVANGESSSSYKSHFKVIYSDLELAFGPPLEGDEYKVSSEWLFYSKCGHYLLTIYDWKSTMLYDERLMSVEDFRASKTEHHFNVGGSSNVDASVVDMFIEYVVNRIRYKKMDEQFEKVILGVEGEKHESYKNS